MTKADEKQGGTAIKLANGALNGLPSRVAAPRYDRSRVMAGIVHIGVGGFHRAHQAVYVDDLLALPGAETWGICGVGLLPHDRRMAEALIPQDCLYTVVERGAGGETSARVVGAIRDFMLAPDDPEAVLERMASEDVRIVSLTITDGGYCYTISN